MAAYDITNAKIGSWVDEEQYNRRFKVTERNSKMERITIAPNLQSISEELLNDNDTSSNLLKISTIGEPEGNISQPDGKLYEAEGQLNGAELYQAEGNNTEVKGESMISKMGTSELTTMQVSRRETLDLAMSGEQIQEKLTTFLPPTENSCLRGMEISMNLMEDEDYINARERRWMVECAYMADKMDEEINRLESRIANIGSRTKKCIYYIIGLLLSAAAIGASAFLSRDYIPWEKLQPLIDFGHKVMTWLSSSAQERTEQAKKGLAMSMHKAVIDNTETYVGRMLSKIMPSRFANNEDKEE